MTARVIYENKATRDIGYAGIFLFVLIFALVPLSLSFFLKGEYFSLKGNPFGPWYIYAAIIAGCVYMLRRAKKLNAVTVTVTYKEDSGMHLSMTGPKTGIQMKVSKVRKWYQVRRERRQGFWTTEFLQVTGENGDIVRFKNSRMGIRQMPDNWPQESLDYDPDDDQYMMDKLVELYDCFFAQH